SPNLKPSSIPCFTQVFTTQRAPDFSAARIFPAVIASRNSKNTRRASGSFPTSPSEARRSIAAFSTDMWTKYKRLLWVHENKAHTDTIRAGGARAILGVF